MINKTNEQLVKEIQAGVLIVQNLEQLYQNNLGFIRKIAGKYAGYAETEDLMQEAYFGLYESVRRFESSHDVLFMTYAAYWIEQAIKRYLINCCHPIRIPEYTAGQLFRYRRYTETYRKNCGEWPSRDEIKAYLHIDEENLKRIEKVVAMGQIESLDEPLKENSDMVIADTIVSDEEMENDIVKEIFRGQLESELWSMVERLGDKQPEIVKYRYKENMTFKAIAETCGITPERVRQQEYKALRALRLPRNINRLKPYLTDTQESAAFHGSSVKSFNRTWTSATERAALMYEKSSCKS